MKSMLEIIEGACGLSNICKLDIGTFTKETGLTTYKAYKELMRLQRNGYLNIFTEQGTTYIRVK